MAPSPSGPEKRFDIPDSPPLELNEVFDVPQSPDSEPLDLSNESDPRVIEDFLIQRSKSEVHAQKEELATLIAPLIDEKAKSFPSIRKTSNCYGISFSNH